MAAPFMNGRPLTSAIFDEDSAVGALAFGVRRKDIRPPRKKLTLNHVE